jgi:hypothetical protein
MNPDNVSKACESCGDSMPDGVRPTQKYCGEKCYSLAKKESDRKRHTYKRNESMVLTEWKRRHPKLSILPSWPHHYGEDLICTHCGTHWQLSQVIPRSKCTNPDAYGEIEFGKEGRPKPVKDMPQEERIE